MNTKDKILLKFPVLWFGWECDSYAWVMQDSDGANYLLMTNHGSKYVAKVSELEERVSEYEQTLAATKEAIKLLSEVSG